MEAKCLLAQGDFGKVLGEERGFVGGMVLGDEALNRIAGVIVLRGTFS